MKTQAAVAGVFILMATSSQAQLVTFEARGHMSAAEAQDFAIGDKFVATYTFDAATPADGITAPDIDAQYLALVSWQFDFERGYSFKSSGQSIAGWFDIGNDKDLRAGVNIVNRYIVTFAQVTSVGTPLPSGRALNFIQIDFDDYANAPDVPDLLSSFAIPTTPPSPALVAAPFGRIDYDESGIPPQPFFVVDSLTVVPEPSTLALLTLGGVIAFAAKRR